MTGSSRSGRRILAGLVLCAVAACGQPLRRWFDADCGDAKMCTSGQCVQGHCARPCTSISDCGDGLCFHALCLPADEACKVGLCNDANDCTFDECNVTTGQCRYTGLSTCTLDGANKLCQIGVECVACAAGDDCSGADHGWKCRGANKCDTGDPKTTSACNPADGTCSGATAPP